MNFIKQKGAGILVCLAIAVPSWLLGKIFPIVGGAIFAILLGMILTLFWKEREERKPASNGHRRQFCRRQSYFLDLA